MLLRLLTFAILIVPALPAAAAARVDAGDPTRYERSLAAIRAELPADQRKRFEAALVQLAFEGVTPAQGIPKEVKLDPQRIHGLTAAGVIALAGRVSSVQVFFGDERPGLPEKFQRPLAARDVAPTVALAGTTWELTSMINGYARKSRYAFHADGRMELLQAVAGGASTWQQVGGQLRLSLNDGYAVWLGSLAGPDAMAGESANVYAVQGTWTGRRVPSEEPGVP